MLATNIALAVCVVLLIIFIYDVWSGNQLTSYEFEGVYVPTPEFLEQAGLDRAIVYIGPLSTFSAVRRGYLFAVSKDGAIMEDQPITLEIYQWNYASSVYNCVVTGANNWGGDERGGDERGDDEHGDQSNCVSLYIDVDKRFNSIHIYDKHHQTKFRAHKDNLRTEWCMMDTSRCPTGVV